jgi:dimethylargininase
MFRNAIVRTPCQGIINGLSAAGLGKPDYKKAVEDHVKYVEILRELGLEVRELPANEEYPDSTFIEDVAVCTNQFAVITNPGAECRRGETKGMKQVLEDFFGEIEEIKWPGTLEGGDVMAAEDYFYIGLSDRTNSAGADQLLSLLRKHNLKGTTVPLPKMLHLKSGVSYLDENNLLVTRELADNNFFNGFNKIIIDGDESYAANSLYINGSVIVPDGFPKTREKIEKAGYKAITADVSEFRKVDGGLSCLSLRF